MNMSSRARKNENTIIVGLGSGVSPDGILTKQSKSATEGAVKLLKKGAGSIILFSGKTWFRQKSKRPSKTEAQAMKDYAISLGADGKKILKEEKSKDTIGNAYFSKQLIKKKKINNIIVVTTGAHAHRAEVIFKMVFGPSYKISLFKVASHFSKSMLKRRLEAEKLSLYATRTFWKSVKLKPGEDKKIKRLIEKYHVAYSKNPILTKKQKQLIERIGNLRSKVHSQ